MFTCASPDYYTRTGFYLDPLQQEDPQTHHPISQNAMLMNQFFSLSLFPKMIFAIHIHTSNPQELLQVFLLVLDPPIFFTESTDQRFKYIRRVISCHMLVIWLVELLFSDNSIAKPQPDETIDLFEIHHSFKYICSRAHTTAFRDDFLWFTCWGDFILSEFKNQCWACSAQLGKKIESGLLFNTNMSSPMRVRECLLVRGIYKGYIEYLNKDNYVTVLFIIERNTEIVPHNQCFQVPIVEGTG